MRFSKLPQSFKEFHAAGETGSAAALVVLYAEVRGATEVDDDKLSRLAHGLPLGVESVAKPIRLESGNRAGFVAGVSAALSPTPVTTYRLAWEPLFGVRRAVIVNGVEKSLEAVDRAAVFTALGLAANLGVKEDE